MDGISNRLAEEKFSNLENKLVENIQIEMQRENWKWKKKEKNKRYLEHKEKL